MADGPVFVEDQVRFDRLFSFYVSGILLRYLLDGTRVLVPPPGDVRCVKSAVDHGQLGALQPPKSNPGGIHSERLVSAELDRFPELRPGVQAKDGTVAHHNRGKPFAE